MLILLFSNSAIAKCKAILINGGASPSDNFNVHTAQLREMYNALLARGCSEDDIHVFSASGSAEALDFRIDPTDPNSRYVSNPYRFNGKSQLPHLYPADKDTLSTKISELSKGFSADDRVFVYVADHGGIENGVKGLVPWQTPGKGFQLFTAEDMDKALADAPGKTRIKLWTECCYCGVFNRMKRSNTCVSTSTDEYHVGSYDWNNWQQYIRSPDARLLSSNAYFAGHVKKADRLVSLASASRVATNKMTDNRDTIAETTDKGCFIGPRDSLEQFMFSTLGFANRQICLPDVVSMIAKVTESGPANCDRQSGLSDIETLKKYLNKMKTENLQLNYSDRKKLDKLIADLASFQNTVRDSSEFRKIQKLSTEFNRLSDPQKVNEAITYQIQVSQLKGEITRKYNKNEMLIQNQRLIIESIFFNKANPSQKTEYNRKKACLDEPLF